MSKAKHTPAPWRVATPKQNIYLASGVTLGYEIESQSDACWIAQVQSHEDCGATAPGDANARLIAAAPDLLDALKWAMGRVQPYTSRIVGQNEDYCDSYDRAKAAIAKAEGRA